VELLIEKGAVIDVISREQNHYTPVMAAAFAGHADVVQVLVDHGADLTVQNSDGSAVLETAIAGGNADTVGLLLEVLGGDDDLQETIAIDIAIAKSIAEIKSGMTKADLLQPATNMETLTQQSMYRAIIGKILKEGGELLKQHALSNMMSIALQDKDLDMVIALLANGANPNQYLAHGQTPLHIAIIQQNAKLVKIMLEWGADPTVSTRKTEGSNYTPLHQALITLDSDQDKDTSIVDLLLKTGQCKLMTGEDARSTAFDYVLSHYSTWDHGVAEIMTFRMVQCTEDIQNDRSDDGSTLMHAAIWHGRADLASILITRSVDINVTDNQGCTPFVLECQRSTRLLRFLLSNGADPYVKDINDQTALHAAASQGKIGVINFLFHLGLPVNTPDKNDYTPFSWAIICGQEDAALHLLNLGAKISHKPFRRGRTLMHTASSLSMSRVVEKLIEIPSLKLLVDHKDGMGWTPLALSCRKAGEDVVSALIDAGADIEVSPNDTLDRPLHLALRAGNSSVAKCLISRGAHVIARGEHGQTALHLAADADIMQILLNRGVETNALDDAGRTPLCGCTDAGLAQLLVGRGAHVNHKSGHDWTSLHRAVASGDVEMFTILMKAGGDVGARTTDDGLDVLERIEEVEDQAMRVEFEKAVLEWKMR
jgi:ankyrin repeat protein